MANKPMSYGGYFVCCNKIYKQLWITNKGKMKRVSEFVGGTLPGVY